VGEPVFQVTEPDFVLVFLIKESEYLAQFAESFCKFECYVLKQVVRIVFLLGPRSKMRSSLLLVHY
jgi:hypothetical protein